MTDADLKHLFTHHNPALAQIAKYAFIRDGALEFARVVLDNTESSADQTAAIRKIREAAWTANSAVALEKPASWGL